MNLLAVDLELPSIGYQALSPILTLLIAACIGVLIEAFVPRAARFPTQVVISIFAIAGSFFAVVSEHKTEALTAGRALSIDAPGLFTMGALLFFGLLTVILFADRRVDEAGSHFVAEGALPVGSKADRALLTSDRVQTEVFPLTLFALAGMMLFVSANNLLVMFVALEVFSLPLYLLAGLNRRRRLLSQEAAVKYFLLGAFASGFLIYGIALVYGYAGTVDLRGIFDSTTTLQGSDALLVIGLALILIGLLFKAGIAPFHAWTPDVYQGSPTPLAGFMSAATKFAAFLFLLRMLYVAFGAVPNIWQPVLIITAILSMIVGALMGLAQSDFKRMLAYSSVAHAGFIMVAVIANSNDGVSGTLFYVATYGITSIAAFACVSLLRRPDGEASAVDDWRGMGRRSPVLAATMTILMLSMTGIPLTAGFIGKFEAFRSAIDAGFAWVVVVALLMSAVTAVFYLRVIVVMYFHDPEPDAPAISDSTPTVTVIGVCTFITVLLGVAPGALLDLAAKAAGFIA